MAPRIRPADERAIDQFGDDSARLGDDGVLVSVTERATDGPAVRAAGTHAAETGGRLVVLGVLPTAAYEERRRARRGVPALPRFTLPQAEGERRRVAARVAREALTSVDVEVEAVGAVGEEAEQVLRVARERRCDHVFLAGGDAVGGSTPTHEVVRAIRERFRGLVTVLTEGEPAGCGDASPG
jgi:hypothetical protein